MGLQSEDKSKIKYTDKPETKNENFKISMQAVGFEPTRTYVQKNLSLPP